MVVLSDVERHVIGDGRDLRIDQRSCSIRRHRMMKHDDDRSDIGRTKCKKVRRKRPPSTRAA